MPDFQSPIDAIQNDTVISENMDENMDDEAVSEVISEAIKMSSKNVDSISNSSSPHHPLEYPNGPVPLDSPFYIPRPPLEEQAYSEILKPGCVLRIKAAKEMGKSSLLNRVLAHADSLGYYKVNINFQQIDIADLNKFLRGFCTQVSRGLHLKPNLDEYWDEDIGGKVNCTCYFQWYLLDNLDRPVVLALNEVNTLFEYPKIAREFLPLLRSWHEEAKQLGVWQKLRLAVVYSTEVYVPLNINQSPFNVGLPLHIPEFTPQQVEVLANLHRLNWDNHQTQALMSLVGGHPLLVRLALYHLAHPDPLHSKDLDQLLTESTTEGGIYREHLRRYWLTLQNNPDLADAIKQAIATDKPISLRPVLAYRLESLGLVTLQGNQISIRYELYRRYFSQQFTQEQNYEENTITATKIEGDRLLELEQQNQQLQQLRDRDDLTGLLTRRSFEARLEKEWQQLARDGLPVSIILCNIDCFKIFNDVHGYSDGNNCLQLIAGVLEAGIGIPSRIIARHGGDEFIAALPQTDGSLALEIAEQLRKQIEILGIPINTDKYGGFAKDIVTVSLGVSSTIAQSELQALTLIKAASDALYQAKRNGRDRIWMSSTFNFSFDAEE